MNACVFVYGSLRPEFANPMSRWLSSHSTSLGMGWIEGFLYDLGDYPGLIMKGHPPFTKVIGTVMRLKTKVVSRVLSRLDEYEHVQTHASEEAEYFRKRVTVMMNGGTCQTAWVFIYMRSIEGLRRIESGDYVQYCMEQDPSRFTRMDRLVPPDETWG